MVKCISEEVECEWEQKLTEETALYVLMLGNSDIMPATNSAEQTGNEEVITQRYWVGTRNTRAAKKLQSPWDAERMWDWRRSTITQDYLNPSRTAEYRHIYI